MKPPNFYLKKDFAFWRFFRIVQLQLCLLGTESTMLTAYSVALRDKMKSEAQTSPSAPHLSSLYHPHLPAVAAGAHGKVQPVASRLVALQEQLVEVLLRLVADVQQDGGIADELFQPCHADVCCTARQVVRCRHTAYSPVHLRRAVGAVDNQRVVALAIHHVPA